MIEFTRSSDPVTLWEHIESSPTISPSKSPKSPGPPVLAAFTLAIASACTTTTSALATLTHTPATLTSVPSTPYSINSSSSESPESPSLSLLLDFSLLTSALLTLTISVLLASASAASLWLDPEFPPISRSHTLASFYAFMNLFFCLRDKIEWLN